jgi:hypothetical protein
MNIDITQLELNVNLYCLQPNFVNLELYYVIATNANTFRFVTWNEEPKEGEQKFYCFLTEDELFIPAGNITIKHSYVLREEPVYPLITTPDDFLKMIEQLGKQGIAKGIRRFSVEDIEPIRNSLCDKYGDCEKHLISSAEAQHMVFVVNEIEISISASMVYFRYKAPFAEDHYSNVKQ